MAKKKKLTGAKRVAYVAGYVAVNSINPFKAVRKASRAVKAVKKLKVVKKLHKRVKKAKPYIKKAAKHVKTTYKKSKKVAKETSKKVSSAYRTVKCKIKKNGCFTEGTLILTENGLVPIEDIEIGDYVWAENPKTGEIELKEVLDTFEKQVDTIVSITVDSETIETTEAHVFYVENVGWLPASMLKQGDLLHLEDGRTVPIESIETTTYNYYVNVYNFKVEDFHTYYVSNLNVLVHNVGCPDKKGSFKSVNRKKNADEVAHHIPQNAYIKQLGIKRDDGPAVLMKKTEHKNTRTFAGKGKRTMNVDKNLNARQRLAKDVWDVKKITGRKYNKGLREAIKYAKTLPEFQK